MVIVNTPHNPSGTVWTPAERERLAELLRPTRASCSPTRSTSTWCSTAPRTRAARACPSSPSAALVVSSFGKTFHVTGWKVGYVAAPAALTREFRKVHQFNVFTVNTPMQHGLAAFPRGALALAVARRLLRGQARPLPRRAGPHAP
jgi:methionine aminotransferase